MQRCIRSIAIHNLGNQEGRAQFSIPAKAGSTLALFYGPHHHQYWVLREDDGPEHCLEMPERYVKEMVADWYGAGRALGKRPAPHDRYSEVRKWYRANFDKMLLNQKTRRRVEEMIGIDPWA